MNQHSLQEIASMLNADIDGDPTCLITGIATLQTAQAGQISFLDNPRYRRFLEDTKASAVILAPKYVEACPVNAVVASDPYLAYAKVAKLFEFNPLVAPGIHATAVVSDSATIHASASVGANTVIGPGVTIAEDVIIGANCTLGDNASLGKATRLWPNVTIYHGVSIGERVILHSSVVIGADGFGMAKDKGRWIKIPQIGAVVIGNDVEIGAGTTVDRGAIGDTIIEDGVKLDNQIQIGHNVFIGANTAMAGCSAVAGSTRIGRDCMIGGFSGINGHIEITDNVVVTGGSGVAHTITTPGVYSSGIDVQDNKSWLRNVMRIRQLDKMYKRIGALEKQITSLEAATQADEDSE